MKGKNIFCIVVFFLSLAKLYAFSLYFNNHFIFFENADFQSYRKEIFRKNQALASENSDDRYKIIYGEIGLLLEKEYKNSVLSIEMLRANHWGADNFQGRDNGQNSLYFKRLHFVHAFSPELYFSLGRQRYEIGNAYWDYFFSDVIDGFRFIYLPSFDIFSMNVSMTFMGDILSNSVRNEETGLYGVIKKDEEGIDDFEGDTLATRAGLSIKLAAAEKTERIFNSMGLRVFSYYLRYGASSKGAADLAENGKNQHNKSDGDFLNMSGLRLFGSFFGKSLSFDLTWAYSRGEDLQFANRHVYSDYAWALNLLWNTKEDLDFQNELCLSLGYFRPRFAGMKGSSMGGMLLWGYKNYQVAPHVAPYHFRDYAKWEDSPQFVDRTNSKSFLKLKESLRWANFSGSLSFLWLWETQSSEYMGSEIELALEYRFDNLKFSNRSALFIPSDYYPRRSLENKFIPANRDKFYASRFSVEYVIDLEYLSTEKKNKKARKAQDRTKELFKKEKYRYE